MEQIEEKGLSGGLQPTKQDIRNRAWAGITIPVTRNRGAKLLESNRIIIDSVPIPLLGKGKGTQFQRRTLGLDRQ